MSTSFPVTVFDGTRCAQRSNGTAAVLAIGTSNPVNCARQDNYADWYFRATKSEHLVKLKDKMKRICAKSGIGKRYFHHTEEMLDNHPEFLDRAVPSLTTRFGISNDALPQLAAEAAAKAITEWRRPATGITHLIVSTNSGAGSPGPDLRVAARLRLRPSVQRTLLYHHGCSGGCLALRLAKDLAENNPGARVLVVCVDLFMAGFRAPDEAKLDQLVAMTLFGDGAGAAIVGAGPVNGLERAIFQMVSASQTTVRGTDNAVGLSVSESGVVFNISAELPRLVGDNVKRCVTYALAPFGLASDLNGLFWAAHPGGRAVLDGYQEALGLEPGKLAVSRRVLSEHGNMLGATVFFVLDKMRRSREQSGHQDGMENCDWGVMLGLGPGVTVEVMVLKDATSGDQENRT